MPHIDAEGDDGGGLNKALLCFSFICCLGAQTSGPFTGTREQLFWFEVVQSAAPVVDVVGDGMGAQAVSLWRLECQDIVVGGRVAHIYVQVEAVGLHIHTPRPPNTAATTSWT